MKKIMFILIITVNINAFSNTNMIVFNNLPQNDEYLDQVKYLYKNEHLVNNFYEKWKFEESKNEIIDRVKILINKTKEIIKTENNNYDIELYLHLLMHYLYNLNIYDYKEQIIEGLNELKIKYPSEYRTYWLLGLHYAKAAKTIEGYNEFKHITDRIEKEKLHPAFIEDLALTEAFSFMFSNSIEDYKLAAKLWGNGYDLKYNDFYQNLVKDIKNPVFEENIPKEEVYMPRKGENYIGFISRLFGLWIPAKGHWIVKSANVEKDQSFFFYKLKNEEKNITYTILIIMKANNNQTFSEFIENNISRFPKKKKIQSLTSKYDFVTYEYEDSSLYKEAGGSHGYSMFYKSSEPEIKGLKIEKPSTISSEVKSKASYYPLSDYYTRYDGEIYYEIMLDTCNEIFEESKDELLYLLDNIIIE